MKFNQIRSWAGWGACAALSAFSLFSSNAYAEEVVDLLVLYTDEVHEQLGGNTRAKVTLYVSETNQALADSGADLRLRLVGLEPHEVGLNDSNGSLQNLRQSSEAAHLRDRFKADLVMQLNVMWQTVLYEATPGSEPYSKNEDVQIVHDKIFVKNTGWTDGSGATVTYGGRPWATRTINGDGTCEVKCVSSNMCVAYHVSGSQEVDNSCGRWIVYTGFYAGRANIGINATESAAFSVVDPLTDVDTFAHELGHNFGLIHTESAADPCSRLGQCYGRGYLLSGGGSTIMNSNGGSILRYSNPNLTFDNGQPMGIEAGLPGEADAVRKINENAPLLAAYRSSGSTTCASADSDPDGDGWGYENGRSCRVAEGSNNQMPTCSTPAADPDGDGFGYENGKSCRIR